MPFTMAPLHLPPRVTVTLEAPRGTFTKRRADGSLDFVSPLPSPFNYGYLEGTVAPDGDPLDAIVLGPRRRLGERIDTEVLAVYGFLDRGQLDPKLVCGPPPLRAVDRRAVERFFWAYERLKRVIQRMRGQSEPTRALGWLPFTTRGSS
ncbi:inorganic diphosphatase [Paraliomyxa miuraensis]|uniref:inorganic diphosphatase n=1 Tax=Paraliomyxa miuraensis TaxID=376150 RepID=UPI002250B771|nr:inorganic diphosphatase [Paraliomyxa miuraensis]MCX4244972.1 inorganic diphosphatase [Paraliomyxa miuraensis]